VDTSPKALSAAGARKVLQLTIEDDTWIDFANPLYGAASILYFNVTARVFSPSGKLLATSTRKLQRDFHYDPNDSLFNQALLSFQPEFTNLINEPAIKSALVP
jgi:outer membrane lipopolysaccharide assembly protein LptE/RlpB